MEVERPPPAPQRCSFIYVSAVSSIMKYGSEVWELTTEVQRAINGVNSKMMTITTGRIIHEEAQKDDKTYDGCTSACDHMRQITCDLNFRV